MNGSGDEADRLRGLVGWLALVGLEVTIRPIRLLVETLSTYPPLFRSSAWATVSDQSAPTYDPTLHGLIIAECATRGVLIVASVVLVGLFFFRHYLFPKVYIAVALGTLLFLVADGWAASLMFPGELMFDPDARLELFYAAAWCAIWVPYMVVSKRVRATFTERRFAAVASPAPSEARRRSVRNTLIGGVSLVGVYVLVRVFVVQVYSNEGPSMEPTLLAGDPFVLSRVQFGLFPAFADSALATWDSPEPGDIVVAVSPADGYEIVKRVIGVGGDTISVRDGMVYRNGVPLGDELLGPCDVDAQLNIDETCFLYRETVGEKSYVVSRSKYDYPNDRDLIVVPDRHVYVLGDHRDSSNDSRNPKIGAIPLAQVRGLAVALAERHDPDEAVRGADGWDSFGPVPAGSLRESESAIELAIYLHEGSRPELLKDARTLAAKHLPGTRTVEELATDMELPAIWFGTPAIGEYQPPDEASLEYVGRGLSRQQVRNTAEAEVALVMVLATEGESRASDHRRLLRFAHQLAEKWGGVIWDEETREIYSPRAWKKARLEWVSGPPDVRQHITIHAYRDDELIRMVTLGMAKFGVPDLVVNQVPASATRSVGNLINLVAQVLVEEPSIASLGEIFVRVDDVRNEEVRRSHKEDLFENAAGEATLSIEYTPPEEGDAPNRLVEIVFGGENAGSAQVEQLRAATQVFGSEDAVFAVDRANEGIEAARKRAMVDLRKLRPRVGQFEPNERLLVKAPFETSEGGTEWMWVEVTAWNDETVSGILANDPVDVPGLLSGARVEVEEESLFDYIHDRPDGSVAGNETGRLIQQLGEQSR